MAHTLENGGPFLGVGVWLAEEKAGQASRVISTARLHVLPRFHLPPIDVLVSHDPSESLAGLGVLILEWASHLDAFSGYPFPT